MEKEIVFFYSNFNPKEVLIMKITVIGKKIEVKQSFKDHVEKKLIKFDKYFKDNAEAKVVIFKEPNRECVELTISSDGMIYRSEQKNKTFLNSLDDCIDIIERQIRKNKTRLAKRLKSGAFDKTAEEAYQPEPEEEGEFVIRYKSFKFKPMSVEEAILQMELLDHDFYIFENDVTGNTNVVYRRQNNEYGCIEQDKM